MKKYPLNGKRVTIPEAGRLTGMCDRTLRRRIYKGMTMQNAIDMPVRVKILRPEGAQQYRINKRREENKDSTYEDRRKRYLWERWKLTPKAYDKMLAAQDGVCAICEETNDDPSVPLAVDHINFNREEWEEKYTSPYRPFKIRGLLCTRCNLGLGYLMESSRLMRRAAVYIAKRGVHTVQEIKNY